MADVDRPDNELIAASLVDDVESFEILVRRHGTAIHHYLSRRTGRPEADELFSEVWLRAFQSRHSYDGRWPDARPWLYGIARNTLRSSRRRAHPVTLKVEPPEDPWGDVDDALDLARLGRHLRAALEDLRPEDREVLLLVTWEGLSSAQVGLVLGIPPGTVRWRLHRARSEFRARFDGHLSGLEGMSCPIREE